MDCRGDKMITLLEINRSINNKIKNAKLNTEFEDVDITSEDVNEPIIRPSIKVSITNSTSGKFNSSCRERNLTVRIYYFCRDRYNFKIENIKMQEILENAFLDDLQVTESFLISIDNFTSETVDTVLISSFDLNCVELLPEDKLPNEQGELMDDLTMNLGKDED